MTESDLHKRLKDFAFLWLRAQHCTTIGMEVFVLDSCHVADVLGASPNYRQEDWATGEMVDPLHPYTIWCVEVKVSRADFSNGYADRGCNKHYILTPKNLLDPKVDLPKHVGLLEFDEAAPLWVHRGLAMSVPCVKVKKRCSRQEIEDADILRHIGRMADMATINLVNVVMSKYERPVLPIPVEAIQ